MPGNDAPMMGRFTKKLIVPGPHGAGLWTSTSGALKDANGAFSDVLFHVGPGRQGTLLESIAVPELRQQAKDTAELLSAAFAKPANQLPHLRRQRLRSRAFARAL